MGQTIGLPKKTFLEYHLYESDHWRMFGIIALLRDEAPSNELKHLSEPEQMRCFCRHRN